MKNLSTFKVFKLAIIVLTILVLINLLTALSYCNSVKKIHLQSVLSIENSLKNIEIQDNKNKIFNIRLNKADNNEIKRITDDKYLEFLIKYNENQAQWLNIWLTILAIALAFIGLIAPLCFMKLYEDKKAEMDKVISDAKEQKEKTELNVEEMEKQLDEVRQKSEQMTKDLKSVKDYVNEARALSKYTEAMNKIREKKLDEASDLLDEALEFMPDNDKVLHAKAMHIYFDKGQYDETIALLNKAILINQKSGYYEDLAIAYKQNKSFENFLKFMQMAIDNTADERLIAYYYSQLAIYYAEIKDVNKTVHYIEKTINTPAIQLISFSNCVVAYIFIGKYNEAINIFEKNIGNRGNATDYYNAAEAYILSNDFIKAINTLNVYIRIQNENTCYGIYFDDYEKWMNAINKVEQTPEIKLLIDKINLLEKRERK